MRTSLIKFKLILLFSLFVSLVGYGQIEIDESTNNSDQLYIIQKHDGVKFIGKIISFDAREVLIETEDMGKIYIPKHVIKLIRPIIQTIENKYISEEIFSTRYFITTNGLPIKKGENYIQWNIYGPDFQFGVADNFGVGVMTSWAAIPVIATAKYSIDLGKNKSMALGLLAGTGSWALPEFGLVLPYASLTLGDRVNNFTFSAGYGGLFYQEENYNYVTERQDNINHREGRFLFSIAGMAKINDKFSIVFDSFISPWGPEQTYTEVNDEGYWDEQTQEWIPKYVQTTYKEKSPNLAILLPGLRWHLDADRAFQFGFTGFYFDGEFVPMPVPMVQWYRRL